MADAVTVRDALGGCRREGFTKVIIESDAQEVVRKINRRMVIDPQLEGILHDICLQVLWNRWRLCFLIE